MNVRIIGEENRFAIRFSLIDKEKMRGYAQLVINNYKLGAWEDEIYIDTMYDSLTRVRNLTDNAFICKNINRLTLLPVFSKLNNMAILIGLTENFDDFILLPFRYYDDIYFTWKLVSKPYFTYQMEPGKIFLEKINYSYYLEVLTEFHKAVFNNDKKEEIQDSGREEG